DAGIFTDYNWSTGEIDVKTIEVDSTGVGFGTKKIYCRVSDVNGVQSDTVYVTFKDCTGIHENSTGMTGISVFPNPSDGNFTLKFNNSRNEQVALILSSLDGREVWKTIVSSVKGDNKITAGKSEMPSGLYLLRIKNSIGESSLKVLVK
ncbi:MAG TPA: T9SS type A sorting domain-containing protein, partial [Bacteroidales bacterium]|nr:T9SS type A sorting domain-containing protein [Bacteroidales bacterium]